MFPDTLRSEFVKFTNADGTATKSFPTCAAKGGIAVTLRAAGNLIETRIITVLRYDGNAEHLICSGDLPAAAAGRVSNVTLLHPTTLHDLDPNNIQEFIGGGHQIRVRLNTAVPSGAFEVSVQVNYGEYPT